MQAKRPPPLPNQQALETARRYLNSGEVIPTKHLKENMARRNFNIQDVISAIESGIINEGPKWDEDFKEYHYRIEGKDVEGDKLTVIVAISVKDERLTLITGF